MKKYIVILVLSFSCIFFIYNLFFSFRSELFVSNETNNIYENIKITIDEDTFMVGNIYSMRGNIPFQFVKKRIYLKGLHSINVMSGDSILVSNQANFNKSFRIFVTFYPKDSSSVTDYCSIIYIPIHALWDPELK